MEKKSQGQAIDELFITLGVWGRFQLVQFMIVKLLSLPASHQLFNIWYIGYQPPLRCHTLESNTTINLSANGSQGHEFYPTCKQLLDSRNDTPCYHGYDYDKTETYSTTTTDWDTVCDRSYQAQLAQTILIAGQALGATLFTGLADRFGRRPVCLFAQCGVIASSIGLAFSPSVIVYLVLRFVIGMFQQGLITMLNVMPIEILPTSHRALSHLFGTLIWNVDMVVFTGLGYVFRDISWRYFQLMLTVSPVLLLVVNAIYLKESIRWLFANNRNEEAMKLISTACTMNKADETAVKEKARACIIDSKDIEKIVEVECINMNTQTVEYTSVPWQSQTKYSFLDILRSPRLRLVSCVMFFGWIVTAFTSFGLNLTTHTLSGDRFLNYFMLVMFSFPPSIISYFTMTRLGRRTTVVAFTVTTGLTMITSVLLSTFVGDSASTAVLVLTLLGTNTMNCVFGTLFQYTPELFPTNLRSLGMGMASTASRIGGMAGPFSNMLIEYFPWAPGTLYGCLSILVSFLYMLLPETVDKELPQTIEEINKWKKNKQPKKKVVKKSENDK